MNIGIKKSKRILLGGSFVLLCLLLVGILTGVLCARAQSAEVVMESEGDAFSLSDTAYEAEQGFVYSADVNFSDGNGYAAGLVFGAADGAHYWVFNMDREANRVKLMYFAPNADGEMAATVLKETYFIGTDTMTAADTALVSPKVRGVSKVQLKVILTPDAESGAVYGEFYADGIRRFRTTYTDDDVIDLNSLAEGITYEGGALGYNTFRSRVTFTDVTVGKSDYAYYTEMYRQQYHFSQYAHWNNDPNGLVYYDGWYHLYFQHHPYSNYWSDMYWGHARSRDLTHWELLPICLFPNTGTEGLGEGDGYAWSGSARVYSPGMSADIDAANWFPRGEGTGLIAFYTRDGAHQDQVIMTSDDGGISWTRRRLISQSIATAADGITGKTDCRDPKVFPMETDGAGNTTLWGMALTGMATNRVWFLKSTNLLDWSYAGGFTMTSPECPDVVRLDLGSTTYTVMTFSGRRYLVGSLRYDSQSGEIQFLDRSGAVVRDASSLTQVMDYGPDSYATQTFYIDDTESEFYGQILSMSWFSGVPNAPASIESGALAAARGTWNGSGMTIPVRWGLTEEGGNILLTETPIVAYASGFASLKTELLHKQNISLNVSSADLLSDVTGRCLELALQLENPEGVPVSIRLNMSEDEYLEIGWNAEEGYYVDRSHASDAGLGLGNYFVRYSTGPVRSGTQSFYILSDQGGIEVFCEDFTRPFYLLTFSSPYATGASLSVGGEVTVTDLTVNAVGNVWREAGENEETVLYLESTDIRLDTSLTPSKEILAYATSGGEFTWEILSGEDFITLTPTAHGALIGSKSAGSAVVRVTCGNASREIQVTVSTGQIESDLPFSRDGKYSGEWYYTAEGLVGYRPSGDGFLLSSQSGENFTYTASFNLGDGAAAALVFRAQADMSDYLIANYDRNGGVVKLWSPRGEIARASVTVSDLSHMTLKVKADGREVTVSVNGEEVIRATLGEDEPAEGLFGLNVCATRAVFRSVTLFQENWTYAGGALAVMGDVSQTVYELYNRTLGNRKLSPDFYTSSGRTLTLSEKYFACLPAGIYTFSARGTLSRFDFTVTVPEGMSVVEPARELSLEAGSNAVLFLGQYVPERVTLDGAPVEEYTVCDGVFTLPARYLGAGEHTLVLDEYTVSIHVSAEKTAAVGKPAGDDKPGTADSSRNWLPLIIGGSVGGGVLLVAVLVTVLLLVKKKKHKGRTVTASPASSDEESGDETEDHSSEK